ncbi:MAG: hypothetical protein AMXMBFR36_35970 [Acidobacteriota bacterium]
MLITGASLAGLAVLIGLLMLGRHVSRNRRGYEIRPHKRDLMLYLESGTEGTRRLVLDGSLLSDGRRVIYFPNEQNWNSLAPSWALSRREEILGRLRGQSENFEVEITDTARLVDSG